MVKKESGSINHANDPLTQCSSTLLVYYFCFSLSTSLQSFCSKNTLYEYNTDKQQCQSKPWLPRQIVVQKLAFQALNNSQNVKGLWYKQHHRERLTVMQPNQLALSLSYITSRIPVSSSSTVETYVLTLAMLVSSSKVRDF